MSWNEYSSELNVTWYKMLNNIDSTLSIKKNADYGLMRPYQTGGDSCQMASRVEPGML